MYQLPAGYREESDNDVQQQRGDELLPVVDRSQLLTDAVLLSPIAAYYDEPLYPIDLATGRVTADLLDPTKLVQPIEGYTLSSVVPVRGYYGVQVFDENSDPIPEKDWTLKSDGVHFEEEAVPDGGTISFYLRAETPCQNWALHHNDLYDGPNDSFARILIRVDDGPLEVATPESPNNGIISTVAAQEVKASYAHWSQRARQFCGDDNNWVNNHLRMRPDVFVGKKDYPGDDLGDLAQGRVPFYQDPASYALNARDGLVTFPDIIDPDDYPSGDAGMVGPDEDRPSVVRANYAHLVGIKNVTRQRLNYQGLDERGHVYKAQGSLSMETPLAALNQGLGVHKVESGSDLLVTARTTTQYEISMASCVTVGDLANALSAAYASFILTIVGQALQLQDTGGGGGSVAVANGLGGGATAAVDLKLSGSSGTGTLLGTQVCFPDATYPDAVGQRMVLQKTDSMPRNIYSNNASVPQIVTVAPYDDLTIKTSGA